MEHSVETLRVDSEIRSFLKNNNLYNLVEKLVVEARKESKKVTKRRDRDYKPIEWEETHKLAPDVVVKCPICRNGRLTIINDKFGLYRACGCSKRNDMFERCPIFIF